MTRVAVYILITKSGPTRDEQLAAIRKTVPLDRQHEVYSDDLTAKYRRKEQIFPQRDLAIKQMRKGDVLVVASPGRLGIGRDDVRGALRAASAKGNAVVNAQHGRPVVWSEDIEDGVMFLDLATLEHKQSAAAVARAKRAELGVVYKPEPKQLKITEAEAELMWRDRGRYPRQTDVATRCGVSTRTLYNRFGPRSDEAPLRRKKRDAR